MILEIDHKNWKQPCFKIYFSKRSNFKIESEFLEHLIDRFLIKNLFYLNSGQYIMHLDLEIQKIGEQRLLFEIKNIVKCPK